MTTEEREQCITQLRDVCYLRKYWFKMKYHQDRQSYYAWTVKKKYKHSLSTEAIMRLLQLVSSSKMFTCGWSSYLYVGRYRLDILSVHMRPSDEMVASIVNCNSLHGMCNYVAKEMQNGTHTIS